MADNAKKSLPKPTSTERVGFTVRGDLIFRLDLLLENSGMKKTTFINTAIENLLNELEKKNDN